MTPQAAAKELEDVMKRVREAQSSIAAAIDPGPSYSQFAHIESECFIVACHFDHPLFWERNVFFAAHSRPQKALIQQIPEIKKVPFQISLSFTFSLGTETLPIQAQVSLTPFVLTPC